MLNKLNWKIVFLFFLFLIVIIISSNKSEAAWQSCVDYHPRGYNGIYALWEGKWYWYADGCYAPPWQNYVQVAYCNGNAPYSKAGSYCAYGCSNAKCNSPPVVARCDENDCDRNDKWYETTNIKWVPAGECKEKEQKLSEYRDYSCSGVTCVPGVTNTKWDDTATQPRNIAGCVIAPKKTTRGLALSGGTIECSAVNSDYDLNTDGKVDMKDFSIFVGIYETTDSRGDFKKDGKVDMDDFFCFQGAFDKVVEVSVVQCMVANGNTEIDPDTNNDGSFDFDDLFAFANCFDGKFYSENTVLCKKLDFNNNNAIDLGMDTTCIMNFIKKNFNCNARKVCSDFNRNGEVDVSDVLEFANCYNQAGECITKMDYGNDNRVGVEDFICFKNDVGKSFGEACQGVSCKNDNECGGAGNYCSFGPKGQGTQGNCCPNGQYWKEGFGCRGAGEIGEACTCPFEQEAGTGKFKSKDGKYVRSSDFIKNSACWALNKACVFTKRVSRNVEQRKLEVERYGK